MITTRSFEYVHRVTMCFTLYALLVASFGSILAVSGQSPKPIPANLRITVWSEPDGNHTDRVRATSSMEETLSYALMAPTGLKTQSYTLSRDLLQSERLDWSTPYPGGTPHARGAIPGDCGVHQQAPSPDSNKNVLHERIYCRLNGNTTVANPTQNYVLYGKD